jgi:hypothetical protein
MMVMMSMTVMGYLSIYSSINQSINQSNNQSINLPIYLSLSISQSVNQSINLYSPSSVLYVYTDAGTASSLLLLIAALQSPLSPCMQITASNAS